MIVTLHLYSRSGPVSPQAPLGAWAPVIVGGVHVSVSVDDELVASVVSSANGMFWWRSSVAPMEV